MGAAEFRNGHAKKANPATKNQESQLFEVVELKVFLHCEECIKKILKAIKKIQDIETYNVDMQLNKVTVTGNVTTEEIIKVLQKIRKTAIPWQAYELNNTNY